VICKQYANKVIRASLVYNNIKVNVPSIIDAR